MNQEPADHATLLIVDDQQINLLILHAIFLPHYRVLLADSGPEALRICEEQRPDLVLLDVLMPDMHGLEVCRRLHAAESTRDTPVIFVTSQENPAEETRALAAGAVDFISKPINVQVVQARVRTHLTLKRQSDLLRSQVFVDPLTGQANRRRLECPFTTSGSGASATRALWRFWWPTSTTSNGSMTPSGTRRAMKC